MMLACLWSKQNFSFAKDGVSSDDRRKLKTVDDILNAYRKMKYSTLQTNTFLSILAEMTLYIAQEISSLPLFDMQDLNEHLKQVQDDWIYKCSNQN